METTNNVLIDEIKELFYAADQQFLGIKDNAILFKCSGCDKTGSITKGKGAEGHETYNWLVNITTKLLSENNFEDVEFSSEEWEKYEKSFKEKTDIELQKIVRNSVKKYNKNRSVYFANEDVIIAESDVTEGKYKLLELKEDPIMVIMLGIPFEPSVYSEFEEGEHVDLYAPLHMFAKFRLIKKNKLNVTPDEIPENVSEYLVNSCVFEGDRELFDKIVYKTDNLQNKESVN